jgi:hemoglobin
MSRGDAVGEEADVDAAAASLYERLGGIYSIATVVDDFIDRIMVDERLNANPRVDEAHHRVLPAGFKYLVTEMLAEAAEGPQHYTGRSMEESHRELLITPEEWRAFMDDLNRTLDKFDVPQRSVPRCSRSSRAPETTSSSNRAPSQPGLDRPLPLAIGAAAAHAVVPPA